MASCAAPAKVLLASSALVAMLGGCDSSDDSVCVPGEGSSCASSTTVAPTSTHAPTSTTSSTTTTTVVSTASTTSLPGLESPCCYPDDTCVEKTERECYLIGGDWVPGGGGCDATTCPLGTHTFDVTLSVTNGETLGALQLDVAYSTARGGFIGDGESVLCTRLTAGFAAFNHIAASKMLSVAIVSLAGFSGPFDIARCSYCCVETLEISDFELTIVDQSHLDFTPAHATVAVTSVRVPGATTTTLAN